MSDSSEPPQPGDVLVMVSTRKGAFLFRSDPARRAWRSSHHQGDWSTHVLSCDERSGGIYAAANHNHQDQSTTIQRSEDGGLTWLAAATILRESLAVDACASTGQVSTAATRAPNGSCWPAISRPSFR